METRPITTFISRWQASGGAERANYQLFLTELCDLIDVSRPEPTKVDDSHNAYVFEKSVTFHHGDGSTSSGRIDLYKRGCFVLESKQGVEKKKAEQALSATTQAKARREKKGTATRGTAAWDVAMQEARGQAESYARALPATEGRPPLIIVVDVGHSIELYAEFTRTGGSYVPFPDARTHRILLSQLEDEDVRDMLRLAWTDSLALDPSRRSARVTREIAEKLGELAKSLEKSGHAPAAVATFLMRALFTMFAEDVDLIPRDSFRELLKSRRGRLDTFAPKVQELWERMNTGGFSNALDTHVRYFNGGLFADATALPLTEDQLELLIDAASAKWSDVEPSIFGTLLERALNPTERHKLGAHYTPRAYVERLVMPTVIEPLREEWDAARAAAITLDREGKRAAALEELRRFLHRLCNVRVLDPACGSGNFLYVTLEHLKRLEGEVLDALVGMGQTQTTLEMESFTVLPRQFHGLEVNPRAAAIAELVIWIGYLQWHFRTRGHVMPAEPILQNDHNIECRDAVLEWDSTEPVIGADGKPVSRWDGRTTKPHPVTGEEVPDESARVPIERYVGPRKTEWPKAEFIVGNPPFIGGGRMRDALGEGYVEALRKTHAGDVPESADLVMYWWNSAAHLVRSGSARQFGFITTNSLRQTFNRRVIEPHLSAKDPVSLMFAIPDHPWVDSADGAAVRIAMTVAQKGGHEGVLRRVTEESQMESGEVSVDFTEQHGIINADLTVGANVPAAKQLRSNQAVANTGVKLHGAGFIVTQEQARKLGLGTVLGLERHIRHYRNGRDIAQVSRNVMVIDLHGLSSSDVRTRFPEVYQWVFDRVKPERDQNNEPYRRENWWLFGRKNTELRAGLAGLPRFIATPETAKHRYFVFLDAEVRPDNKLIVFAFDDAYQLGVLASRIHVVWALAAGSHLGVGNDPVYVKTACFEKYPFPAAAETQKTRIRELAESLDAHRKRQQAQHPKLTLTDIYNVLSKLRAGETLSPKEQVTHEQGLVSVLRQLHDDLDAAVAEAYDWPSDLSDDEILNRLVALNLERAAEERRGTIRWLRPEFQAKGAGAQQTESEMDEDAVTIEAAASPAKKLPWPKGLADQARAVREALIANAGPADVKVVASLFKGARTERVEELLDTLASLGQARLLPNGEFAAS